MSWLIDHCRSRNGRQTEEKGRVSLKRIRDSGYAPFCLWAEEPREFVGVSLYDASFFLLQASCPHQMSLKKK